MFFLSKNFFILIFYRFVKEIFIDNFFIGVTLEQLLTQNQQFS